MTATRRGSMKRLREYEAAEAWLEYDLLDILFGIKPTGPPEDLDKLTFEDWYFDPYDASVELLGTQDGWAPTPEQLQQLADEIGIHSLFVSYRDGTAKQFTIRFPNGGQCSARAPREERNGSALAEARRRIRELEAERGK